MLTRYAALGAVAAAVAVLAAATPATTASSTPPTVKRRGSCSNPKRTTQTSICPAT
jgi:hypothetical protein